MHRRRIFYNGPLQAVGVTAANRYPAITLRVTNTRDTHFCFFIFQQNVTFHVFFPVKLRLPSVFVTKLQLSILFLSNIGYLLCSPSRSIFSASDQVIKYFQLSVLLKIAGCDDHHHCSTARKFVAPLAYYIQYYLIQVRDFY